MDAADGLQFSSEFQEAEYYLLSACEFYEKLCPDVGSEHIEMLTGLILIQCSNHSIAYIDAPYPDILRSETLAIQTLQSIALTCIALRLHRNAHQLYSFLDLEDKALRGARHHGSRRRSVQPRSARGTETRRMPVYLGRRAGAEGNGGRRLEEQESNEESEDV